MKKGNTIKKIYSYSGFEINEVYSKKDLPNKENSNLEVNSNTYSWNFNQSTSSGNPEKINKELHFLVEQGYTNISLELDNPTQLGIDSDDIKSCGKVGKTGVPVDTIDDLDIILKDISIENLSIDFGTDFTAPILYGMFLSIAEKRNIPLDKIKGSIRNDILGGFISEGILLFPTVNSFKLLVDTVEFITEKTPNFHAIKTHGTREIYKELTAVEEIAFSISKATTYIDSCIGRGLNIDDFSDKISFSFHTKSDFFEEMAKYRAAKRIWNELISNHFHAKKEKGKSIHFDSICEPINSVSTQLENNLIRIAYQVMASSLGGAHTISCRSFDQYFSEFNEESLILALRTQQILCEETGILNSEDLFSGSYFLENLTNLIYEKVKELLEKIEVSGGTTLSIEKGIIRKWSLESHAKFKNKIQSGEQIILGLNKYIEESEEKSSNLTPSKQKEIEKNQIEKLGEIKIERDSFAITQALKNLEKAAKANENLISPIMSAIKLHATIGEIVDALKNIFGEYVKQE